MIRNSLFALGLTVVVSAVTGCAADADDEGAASDVGAVTAARMIGDFHISLRTLDEAFLFDGAVSELRITEEAGDCHFEAFQVTGGCDAQHTCSEGVILSDEKLRDRIEGACTITSSKLTLSTPAGELSFKVAPGTASHGRTGFVITSANGKKLNKAGSSSFFERTSRDPGEALARAYSGGAEPALTKLVTSSDPSLSPAVRAGLQKLETELSEPLDDISRDPEETFAIFATPWDSEPVGYAVSSTHSGDHCGGYQVFAIDTNGKRIETELSDGDCGL